MKRSINPARVVVKLGTNVLSVREEWSKAIPLSSGRKLSSGSVDLAYLYTMAQQVSELRALGKQVILVTSGAIGMGARELGIHSKVTGVEQRQACAAIGQPLLMQEYRAAFDVYGLTVAQVLITRDVMNNRTSYNNLRNAVENLLSLGVIPIFNENDAVSTDEIGSAFGDNDQLSALVASKIDAELLVILSDIDGLYSQDPKVNPEAQLLKTVNQITPDIYALAGDRGSEFATGGMKTKIKAVEIARDAGCPVILTHGRIPQVLIKIIEGEEIGTLFLPAEPLRNRTRWLKNAKPSGSITIDQGALEAIRNKRSLLPKGITEVKGSFQKNQVILVNQVAHVLCPFSSEELKQIMGKHSDEIRSILGSDAKELIARPEDMVFLD